MIDLEKLKQDLIEVIPEDKHQAVADTKDLAEIVHALVDGHSINKNNWPEWLKKAEVVYVETINPAPEPDDETIDGESA